MLFRLGRRQAARRTIVEDKSCILISHIMLLMVRLAHASYVHSFILVLHHSFMCIIIVDELVKFLVSHTFRSRQK